MIFGHMRGIQLREDLYFLLNVFNLVFCTLQVYNLDCHRLLSSFIISDRMPISMVTMYMSAPIITNPLNTSPKDPFPFHQTNRAVRIL